MSILSWFIAMGLIVAAAVLNRIRGGGFWIGELFDPDRPNKLWGRALYPVALGMGLLAYYATGAASNPQLSVPTGIIFTVGYAIWAAPAWGHLTSLSEFFHMDDPSKLESWLLKISGNSYTVALFLRMMLCAPFFVALAWLHGSFALATLAIPFAALCTLAYSAGWDMWLRGKTRNPYLPAELLCGQVWGSVLAAAYLT